MRWAPLAVILLAFVMMAGQPIPADAASAPANSALSWEECVRRAQAANADLMTARETRGQTEAQEGVARSGYLPQVTGNLGYSYGVSTSSTFSSNPDTNTAGLTGSRTKATTSYTANLGLTQNLFAGFQDRAKVAQAEANTRASQAAVRIAEAKVAYELRAAFEGAAYAKDDARLTRDIVRRREDDLRMVELRFDGGRENKGSVLLSKAYLQQARLESLQADHAIATSASRLARVLGEDPDGAPVSVQGETPVTPPAATSPDFAVVAASTPERNQALAREDAADEAVRSAKSAFYPSLNLTGTAGRQGADFFPADERWSVGLGLSIPLFAGGKDFYGARAAARAREASASTVRGIEQQALTTLKEAWAGYVEAVQKLEADRAFLAAANVRAEIARSKYQNGLISFEDWDQIENDLIAREKSALASRRDRVVAEAAWNQAVGQGLTP